MALYLTESEVGELLSPREALCLVDDTVLVGAATAPPTSSAAHVTVQAAVKERCNELRRPRAAKGLKSRGEFMSD